MNNKKEKTLSIIKLLYILSMLVVVITLPLALILKPLLYVSLSFIGVVIVLYIIIHVLRSKYYEYTCPACKNKFSISFGTDITSFNSGVGTKVLVCPKCNTKEVMKQNLK